MPERPYPIVTTKAHAPLEPMPRSGFKIGILKDKVGDAPDFLEPMAADELDWWEGRERTGDS